MNFAWHKFRHLIAVSMTQSIILSQTCAVTIAAQPAGDESLTNTQNAVAMVNPQAPPHPPDSASESGTTGNTGNKDGTGSDQFDGLRFKISPGKPTQDSEEIPPVAHTKPLSEAETEKLLKLLPPLVQEESRQFVLPGKSLPPPNKQNRLTQPFPPREQKVAPTVHPASSPLKITNKRPFGSVDHASAISISFSQPMVPIATQGSLETKTPPVSFKPAIEGQWKWFGTQTLTFEPSSKQLPMSTLFELNVPAGTTSVTGGKLSTSENWHFSTSTVKLVSSYPNVDRAVRPNTLIMASFNQKIDKAAILASTQILVEKKSFPIISASQSEIDSDADLKSRLKGLPKNTFVVFKAASSLPLATSFEVKIGPNIKSAEGPLLSKNPAYFQFKTYGPFKVLPQPDYEKTARPEEALYVRFSNMVDSKSVNASTVVVSPPIPDVQIQTNEYDSELAINGIKKPKTNYQVQLKSGLKDIFGQTLAGNARTLKYAVSSAEKQLFINEKMTVLPSEHKPKFEVTTVALNAVEMQLYSVSPQDYASFQNSCYDFVKHRKPFHIETIKIKNIADQVVTTNVDLGRWLNNNRGSLVVKFTSREMPRDYQLFDWVQATNIGLNALTDHHSVKAWVTELSTGRPIKGAKVFLVPSGTAYQTDEHGLVTVPLKKSSDNVLVAKHGNDTALVTDYSLTRSEEDTDYLWYAVTDRSPYRPGEKINVKGMLRRRLPGPTTTPIMPEGIKHLSYRFMDCLNNEIGKGKATINKFGGFDLSFTLPEKVNLGNVTLILTADEHAPREEIYATDNVTIKVSEFRRPEFELKVKNDGPSVHIIKGATTLSATTNYFAGGSLAHADINWSASSTSTTYSPPGWSDYLFGKSRFRYFDYLFSQPDKNTAPPQSLKGTTDGAGKNYLHVDYLDVHPSEPSNLTISATVQDVNRQTWTDSTTLLVHPSELYVGNKLDTVYVKKDSTLPMSCIVTNIDGKAVENIPIKIELYRSTEQTIDGKQVEKKDDVQTLNITSGAKPVDIKVQPKLGGTYQVISSVIDSAGRRNETITTFFSDGGAARAEANAQAKFDVQKLILLPEKTEYTPGDRAKVLVQSPFYPAEGLATVWHNGLSKSIPFHMEGSSYSLELPIAESDLPEIELQVDILGIDNQNPKTQNAPGEATGSVTIDVSEKHKKLTVVANPDVASTEPGKEVSINIDVTDYKGAAVAGAEVTLAVVDDALLSLLNYKFSDPLQTFYPHLASEGITLREREYLDMTAFLKNPNAKPQRKGSDFPAPPLPGGYGGSAPTACPAPSPAGFAKHKSSMFGMPESDTQFQMIARESSKASSNDEEPGFEINWGGSRAGKNTPVAVQLRSNFDALAKWAPSVVTDEKGHAVVKFKLPDNLTRYRVMAVASHADSDFGIGDSALTVRLPLMVKPSAPRFLNYGDKFELPVVLRNQTDAPIEVDVAARATNVEFTQGQGRHTTIAANDRVEVRLPASALKSGTARFQVITLSGTDSDAAEFSLPIYTPATTEAFATYGQIENGAVTQSIETPEDVIPDYGSLELTTSTTVLETLTDAFIYLQHYPFDCSEQISSRLISISLLKDMLKEFHAAGVPNDEQIAKTVTSDLRLLNSRQHKDGSFALWKFEERDTYPYVTLTVAQALILAKKAGYKIDSLMLERTMRYLKEIDKHIADYKGSARTDLKALALYLRDQNGDSDVSAAHKLFTAQPPDDLSLEALGHLLQIFAHKDQSSKDAVAIYTYLNNCVVETASTAEVVRNASSDDIACSDYRLFDSPSKVKAILLDSLLAEGKSPEVVTKLMRSLLGGQVKGRWRNTQENAYVLLAMRHYFDKYEKTVPDLMAEAWLGKTFIGETSFKGRTNDFKTISLPMGYLCDTAARTEDLILRKTGSGRLYYRLGLNYAPKSLHLSSMDRGFNVTRTYEGVTNKDDVKRSSEGIWQFKAGSLVKVKVNITASSERFFVAMVDPLPAGAESLNQDLNGTESVSEENSTSSADDSSGPGWWGWRWWNMSWWNHENKRDNQTEVFANQLWGGTHEYSYLIRATTPGQYVVPPTKAEEMYAPETFGRTASETVVIE